MLAFASVRALPLDGLPGPACGNKPYSSPKRAKMQSALVAATFGVDMAMFQLFC